jgi:predicted nucleic acid-binding protein
MVPVIWPLEVANVLAIAERRGRISAEDADRFTRDLRQFPIIIEDGDSDTVFGAVLSLARDHNLSACDASHLELAVRRRLPLATLDARLLRAAEALGVPVL